MKDKSAALNSADGFSLTELMVVIALIAIVLGFGVPAFNHYSVNTNLRTAARDIASDIFTLRERAISENRQYMIEFTLASNQYTLNQGAYSGEPWTAIQVKTPSSVGSDVRLTEAAFSFGTPRCSFRPGDWQAPDMFI